MTIKARVHGGRLLVDEPTNLPEGTEVELLPLDPGDWLEDADREALHAALAQPDGDIAGRLIAAVEVTKDFAHVEAAHVRFTAKASQHVDRHALGLSSRTWPTF